MDFTTIGVSKYKLFNKIRISNLAKVNVIIGKNNCGKSSLLDVIGATYSVTDYHDVKNEMEGLTGSTLITDEMISDVFQACSGIGKWNRSSYAKALVGKVLDFFISDELDRYVEGKCRSKIKVLSNIPEIVELKMHWKDGVSSIEETINNTIFRRLSAERDIVPEEEKNIGLSMTGIGASNLIRKILNESAYDETLIEKDLLDALNDIMYPEAEFEGIRVQQITNENTVLWEVFLQEKGKQRIPLSKTGSGLKTIILMLLNLLVIPRLERNSNKRYIYGFEELENNLHPAMQRKVFEYIYDYAIKNDVVVFLTTHSHVAINCFYDKEQTSIYHIEKKDGQAEVKRIDSYLDKVEILEDLDIKASDILQSNGIIWVEGPSDRVYIKRWLEIFTDNEYKEGQHYQFLYYGGRLLAQYSLEEETELISILTTNRNAAIIMDSDKKNQQEPISETKRRIANEFTDMNMFSWITEGKEIENYIPVEAIREKFQNPEIKQCRQYELFPNYISKYYNCFDKKKVQFANEVKGMIILNDARKVLDLEEKIEELYEYISGWNK
ncbi:MAG: AAA family ATPase [bacterium]|nr:AAA family ATPase [bacterium]